MKRAFVYMAIIIYAVTASAELSFLLNKRFAVSLPLYANQYITGTTTKVRNVANVRP